MDLVRHDLKDDLVQRVKLNQHAIQQLISTILGVLHSLLSVCKVIDMRFHCCTSCVFRCMYKILERVVGVHQVTYSADFS